MFKRSLSLILTFLTFMSLLNIAIVPVSATENTSTASDNEPIYVSVTTPIEIPIIPPPTVSTEPTINIPVLDFSDETSSTESTTSPVTEGLLGDVTLDSKVNIRDATAIQKHLAKIKLLSDEALQLADFDKNDKLNIKDATTIQKFIAGLVEDGSHTHLYAKTIVDPTCTEKGYTLFECDCGDSYKSDWNNETDHTYQNDICTVCGNKKAHTHTYKSTTTTPTCKSKGYTVYTCTCGDQYTDNWTDYADHSFYNYECTECGLSPFEYYKNWLKENGTIYGDHYEYIFTSVNEIEGLEDYTVKVLYYPKSDYFSLKLYYLFNGNLMFHTICLDNNDPTAYCICGNDMNEPEYYYLTTEIDITTFTDNTTISAIKFTEGSVVYLTALEHARQYIVLTILAHEYGMREENVGVTLEDLGFYSFFDL